MYVIVVGCGRVGSQLAVMLAGQGNDVVIIDNNPNSFRRLGPVFNGLTITGLGFDEGVLREAGIEKADVFAAVTELDNTNLMTAEVASKIFNVPKVVARLYHPDREATYRKLGIDYVCGTTLVAGRIFNKLTGSPLTLHFALEDGFQIVEFPLGQKHDGKKVAEIEKTGELRIVSIIRQERSAIVEPEFQLKKDDTIIAGINKKVTDYIKGLMK